jgi:putative ABC transport system permease protein
VNTFDAVFDALRALRVNVMRSVLTTLGIIIGVAAVIVMVSVGAGAQSQVDSLIQSLGSNLLIVLPGTTTVGGVQLGTGSRPTITEDDAAAMQREIEAVQVAAPMLRGSAQIVFGNLNWSTLIYGVTPEFFDAREWKIGSGRAFSPEEIKGGSKVTCLGETVVNSLFSGESPLGQIVRIKRVPFEVIGVLEAKGQTPSGQDQDDVILIPLSTAQKRVLGTSGLSLKRVTSIVVKAKEAGQVSEAEGQVRDLLRQRHRLRPGQDDDFSIRNLSQVLETRAESSRTMSWLLAAVASVSLIVGGIGIMNIMLVSVTERTREIGLRMAVGARGRDVLMQFLIEAVTLSLIGGLIGIVLGVAGSVGIALFSNWPIVVAANSIVLAFAFSAGVGVFFGFYPARKAARLDPIEALRHE